MVGLIFKIGLFFAVVFAILIAVLNITNVWNPGTIGLSAPDDAPCHRYLEANYPDRETELVQVRWVMTMRDYGWGCYIEFGDFDVITVSPMPK